MTQSDISRAFREAVEEVKTANEVFGGVVLAETTFLQLLNYKLQVAIQEEQNRQVVPAGGSMLKAVE